MNFFDDFDDINSYEKQRQEEIKLEKEHIDNLSDFELVEYLQNCLLSHATGGSCQDEIYKYLRLKILKKSYKEQLPKFVITCRDISQFWSFIKTKFGTYQERREYIWEEFSNLLELLEINEINKTPLEEIKFNEPYIHTQWKKALERKDQDPEGAITISRTLIESLLKYILDEEKVDYNKKSDLSELYKKVAKILNMAPENYNEKIFKQILSGINNVINGLGTLRNHLGDSHGQGKKRIKPKERHSELAVNLAGSLALFLYKTYNEYKAKKETK